MDYLCWSLCFNLIIVYLISTRLLVCIVFIFSIVYHSFDSQWFVHYHQYDLIVMLDKTRIFSLSKGYYDVDTHNVHLTELSLHQTLLLSENYYFVPMILGTQFVLHWFYGCHYFQICLNMSKKIWYCLPPCIYLIRIYLENTHIYKE